jgi:glycosyltransferase involved in cell wall biosynthesis
MNVTVVCDVLGEPNNGTTIATLNLINYLKSQGHTVRVVCGDQDKKGIENYYILPVLDLGYFCNKIIKRNGVTLAKVDKDILREAIEPADVVQIQFPFAIGQAAAKMAKEMHKPITASFHCQAENVTAHLFMINNSIANKITYEVFYHKMYKYCDCIHYPTAFIRDTFETATHKTNGFVISNGVNKICVNKHLLRSNDKFTIVSTGRYSTEKAQRVLIKAISLSKYRDKIRLYLAGEGPLKQFYKTYSKRKKVDTVLNFYSREDLVQLLNTADLYVHPAFIEIEAIACIEAICCGLVPVISNAKRSATKSFALDDNNLFKENNPYSLAEKINFWYEHPELKSEYVERYRPMVQNFSQDECMARMEQMLQTAIDLHNNKK